MKLREGQKVEWTSQAGGNWKKKTGIIVYMHDSICQASPFEVARRFFPDHRHMFDGLSWESEGVLVEVRDGKTDRARPKLYMPKISKLSAAK